MMKDPNYEIYVSRVEDKFGDNGIVFLLIAKKEEKKYL